MKLERTLLDKFVSGAFMGKRQIGRPLKYNLKRKNYEAWLELVFKPKSAFQLYVSRSLRMIMPYLSWFTYRFHVEKARDGGFRVEDVYMNKFWKEPWIHYHIYSQYFHPETILERVRNVHLYRRPRTMFKGFTVPDWAQSQNNGGWDLDVHSRLAWENAIHDMNSEATPLQFAGQRLEPNIIEWFRIEQIGKGASSRLFFNENPKPTWFRYGNVDNKNKQLYSFTHGDQDHNFVMGIDTTTAEGREEFQNEWNKMAQMVPELIDKDNIVYPHEVRRFISSEPHFQRVWQLYREHTFKLRFAYLVEEGEISSEDAETFKSMCDDMGTLSMNVYFWGKAGLYGDVSSNADHQACGRILEKMGLDAIEFNFNTSKPFDEQFWTAYDYLSELTEEGMRKQLPYIITDPKQSAKVEALIDGRIADVVGKDVTSKLELVH